MVHDKMTDCNGSSNGMSVKDVYDINKICVSIDDMQLTARDSFW